jgi:hypothetical protein
LNVGLAKAQTGASARRGQARLKLDGYRGRRGKVRIAAVVLMALAAALIYAAAWSETARWTLTVTAAVLIAGSVAAVIAQSGMRAP